MNMDEKMVVYTNREQFIGWNCAQCRFYDLPESGRPCNESIPFLFCGHMWYPEYCPYLDRRPLTDAEKKELDKMIDEYIECVNKPI